MRGARRDGRREGKERGREGRCEVPVCLTELLVSGGKGELH